MSTGVACTDEDTREVFVEEYDSLDLLLMSDSDYERLGYDYVNVQVEVDDEQVAS